MSRDFWTRRRQAVSAEEQAEVEALAAELRAEEEADLDARSDEVLLAEHDLPEPELLESPDAVREFLTKELPQRLKTRALRRLWRLNPTLANLDGLVDYGEDFTDSATVVENLQTAYQVGKGMMAHVQAQLEAAAEPAPVESAAEPESDLALVEGEEDVTEERPEDALAQVDPAQDAEGDVARSSPAPAPVFADMSDVPADQPAPRRRMTFEFEV
ncbi:DUF3306 domain-containing protein [Aliishimia ponticola]|uniref:DUF3306 domain-containing protein n=1 Tax=Aliishimia ponticola TaxID=2499833 RepID=A0A4S4N705_9RHOB|nr:DUF3306 domain-containing protein [Aliishimia ponticola]THH34849.1 DUF3306 domain-containing protein [Aliishimia ponticola]